MQQVLAFARRAAGAIGAGAMLLVSAPVAHASNHLDTPTAIANPQANIGDMFAWVSPDGRRLNLVMDIVGRSFSDRLQYVIHIDSGKRLGATTSTTTIVCRFGTTNAVTCRAGGDLARGDASGTDGLESRRRQFRVFAGLRADPFFNNVRGTRAAYQVATAAMKNGAEINSAGCPRFDQATTRAILDQFRHTNGGPATNFLATWTTSALVISIDLGAVDRGGAMLAVWGATTTPSGKQLDRVGRPMMKNSLLGLFQPDETADALKERYNLATPATSSQFIPAIQRALALYDGFDGTCGNSLLSHLSSDGDVRYGQLATLFADDRLWINSASANCTHLFAVELAALAGRRELAKDCGGRSPNYNAANVYRSLLVTGADVGFDDGLTRNDRKPSDSVFPFLAPPGPGPAGNP